MKLTPHSGTRLARGRNGGARALALTLVLGCGAKTGLIVPAVDAPPDRVDATPDVPLDVPADTLRACIAETITLTPRQADAVFVLDRSGSMDEGLSGSGRAMPGAPSRWRLLQAALASTLPTFNALDVGALFFPEVGSGGMSGSCSMPNVPALDVEPAPDNAARVIAAVEATGPSGATPTFAALNRAYTWIVRNPSRSRARYLVLSTDGGPNCNAALDSRTCVCTGGAGACMGGGGLQCLDDARTIEIIHEIATNPATAVPTYVIGIAPDAEPAFSTTLTAMAIAGGRPRIDPALGPTFYSVRADGDLATVLTAIQGSIAQCSFVTPSAPDDPGGISITLDGADVPRDTTRATGWDWTNEAYGEITLFGATCDQAIANHSIPVATIVCRDR